MSITDNLKIAVNTALPPNALSRLVGKLAAAEAGNLTTRDRALSSSTAST